ncbi:carboxymuconolactone decarboxylase family protein [Sandaracinus amylolyticus]|uniref:carboxymuconolactone decarboxylase family protein n=1 Tax=Sandaracinus amylolyticus TaxID=927083 RepID=UPI001F22033B|nr:carboxymuconolactone decarboxylase family protein [Sandaracinus amylolyticus]UJR86934.1 Hypothetical protein I5071_90350 [Sandaracinus amylolyticus]
MTTFTSEHGSLPLAPVERPRSLFVRLLFRLLRARYGVVPTAFRVIYARTPWVALISVLIVLGLDRFLVIDRELRLLLQLAISSRAHCTFCSDINRAEALRARMGRERFDDLLDFETSPAFTEREKAALAYASALHESTRIPDAIWTRLGACFSERERVDIVWVCAVERYYNSMALPLRIGTDRLAA